MSWLFSPLLPAATALLSTPTPPSPIYKGALTRTQAYLGTRSDATMYKGTRVLFP